MPVCALPIPQAIDVPLREKRSYLHSTNLFDFLVASTGADSRLSLSFRRKIEHEVQALPAAEVADVESFPARFSGERGDARVDMVFAERQPLTPLRRREPYNEAAVTEGCRIDGLTIHSDASNGATPIERIVALNKWLIAQTTAPDKILIFSKISLATVPRVDAALTVRLKSRLGLTLFRSTIAADGAHVGEIVFYGT
jgi:hypothetical protein